MPRIQQNRNALEDTMQKIGHAQDAYRYVRHVNGVTSVNSQVIQVGGSSSRPTKSKIYAELCPVGLSGTLQHGTKLCRVRTHTIPSTSHRIGCLVEVSNLKKFGLGPGPSPGCQILDPVGPGKYNSPKIWTRQTRHVKITIFWYPYKEKCNTLRNMHSTNS